MDILLWAVFFVIGIVAGLVGGLLGLSGGAITIPCLVLVFNLLDFPQDFLMHTAVGTSLASMIFTGIASTWTHAKAKYVRWKIVLSMFPGITIGCLLGAFLAHFLASDILQEIFGAFLVLLGATILLIKKKEKQKTLVPDETLYTWIGLGIGVLSSFLGVGGGIFILPLLLSYHYSEHESIGTSAACGTVISLFATVAFMYFGRTTVHLDGNIGYIYLPAFLAIGVGSMICAPLGAKIAHRLSGKKLRQFFAAVAIMIGILMFF